MGAKNKILARVGAGALVVAEPIVGLGSVVKSGGLKVRANYRDHKSFIEEQQELRALRKAMAEAVSQEEHAQAVREPITT